MREAAIVSTARTPIGKAVRGAFNATHGVTLAAHAIAHAAKRAAIDPVAIEDVILGCGFPEGSTGSNVARLGALRAGLPVTTAAETVNRFCSSGLMAISIAAQRIIVDGVETAIAGGVEFDLDRTQRAQSKLRSDRRGSGAREAGNLSADAGDRRDRGATL